jgi:murein DD-endopeptidase MepM/ murein hydrolase activator NlpD
VLAAGSARVRFSGWDPLLGELVILDHGAGLETWYAHLSSRLVHDGLRVHGGSAIGNVGNTGRSAAPHLHLTIKLDGEAVDPLPYFENPGSPSRAQ